MPAPLDFSAIRVQDENGNPVPGAKAYFYQPGTTTPITVYQDSSLTTPHATPVVADANGTFDPVYYNGSYKVTVTDADDAVLPGYPLDNLIAVSGTIGAQDADNVAITGGTIDATAIGGTTPAAGAFTTLGASGLATLSGGMTASGTLTGLVGRLINIQVFDTAGAATYTPTTGTKTAVIRMVGAGGGAGGADGDTDNSHVGAGGGGGGGAYIEGMHDVSAGSYSASITIGAGGAGGTSAGSGTAGTAGGSTIYDDGTIVWTAGGGGGGQTRIDVANIFSAIPGDAGTVVGASGALVSYAGEPGAHGFGIPGTGSDQVAIGGKGASSPFGSGGLSSSGGLNGVGANGGAASGFGAGGGGASAVGATTPFTGGAGADGLIVIYEYSA